MARRKRRFPMHRIDVLLSRWDGYTAGMKEKLIEVPEIRREAERRGLIAMGAAIQHPRVMTAGMSAGGEA